MNGMQSPDNGFRPAGLIELSSTTLPVGPISAGLRHQHRIGHGDAQPDALPRSQRRPGVRRRHGLLGLGP